MTAKMRLHPDILQDYVDNQLDDDARVAIARDLADSPEDRARVDAYQEQAERLHRAYDPVLTEAVPDRLTAVLREADGSTGTANENGNKVAAARRRRTPRRWWPAVSAVAAGLVMTVVGTAIGWQMHARSQGALAQELALETFLRNATNSYSLYGRADSPWQSTPEGDLKRFLTSFKKSVGIDIHEPRLDTGGYQFVGAWPLPSHSGPAGQLVYKDSDGHRIAIYFQVASAKGRTALDPGVRTAASRHRFTRRGDVSVVYWDTGDVSYALLGELEKQRMTSVAEGIFGES